MVKVWWVLGCGKVTLTKVLTSSNKCHS